MKRRTIQSNRKFQRMKQIYSSRQVFCERKRMRRKKLPASKAATAVKGILSLSLTIIFFLIAVPSGIALAGGADISGIGEEYFSRLQGENENDPQNIKTSGSWKSDKNKDITIENVKIPKYVKVWRENKRKVEKVDLEEYVTCVTASEMPATFHEEALKAQSVAARTFVMSKIEKYQTKNPAAHPKTPVCDTTHCQVYKTQEELKACHPSGWYESKDGWKKIEEACEETEGKLLYYDGELVMQPLFFSSSGGQTENSEDVFVSAVPYLVSVESPYEENATHQNEKTEMRLSELKKVLKKYFPEKEWGKITRESIKVLSRTSGGRVSQMQIGDAIVKGTEVRNALGLRSTLFTVGFEGKGNAVKVIFTSSGNGHGVGMSQYGADGMAKKGYTYQQILEHYYVGAQVF